MSDDSPCLQGRGFWNDAGESSHTVRSVHAQKRAMLKITSVSHSTTLEHGRVFTHCPRRGTHQNAIQLKTCTRTVSQFFLSSEKWKRLFCKARPRGFHPQV
jgi:hypothetical protein